MTEEELIEQTDWRNSIVLGDSVKSTNFYQITKYTVQLKCFLSADGLIKLHYMKYQFLDKINLFINCFKKVQKPRTSVSFHINTKN